MNEANLSEDEWNCFKIRMYFQNKEILYSLKHDVRFLIFEKAKALVEEKQVFISMYLQDLHIYLSVIPGLRIPCLKLVKDMELDGSKICRSIDESLLHQESIKKFGCNCNRNFTINRVCLDL